MNNLIEITGVVVHQDANGRFSLNDLHKAAGGEGRHRPSMWLENQQAKALVEELESEAGIPALVTKHGGAASGTYVVKELVYAYAMWISATFNLKVIRTFDQIAAGNPAPTTKTIEAAKLFKPFFQIARLIGCDKSAAAISANQAVQKVSGTDLLELMGKTHLEAENQDAPYLTATELGKRIGVSAQKVNLLLAGAGFQMKRNDMWEVLDAGRDFARIFDTGKAHGSGVPIQQIKWSATVLPLLKPVAEEA